MIKTPVVLLTFNRPDTTIQVFEQIRRAEPQKLYLVSDAAREGRIQEAQKVSEIRDYIEHHIDWPCTLYRIYAENNMGCQLRVSGAITEVFQREEAAIMLEDDCVPHIDFFRYCEEMLEKYKADSRIMMVSGCKLAQDYPVSQSYFFSNTAGIWGWATWKRAWEHFDFSMKEWPEFKKSKKIHAIYPEGAAQIIEGEIDRTYQGTINSWAYRWLLARLVHGGLGIVPGKNLVQNIGLNDENATHTKGEIKTVFRTEGLSFPLIPNDDVTANREYEKEVEKIYYRVNIVQKLIVQYCPEKITRGIKKVYYALFSKNK